MAQKDQAASILSALSTESGLVEAAATELMEVLGWSTANLLHEAPGPKNPTGRLPAKIGWIRSR